MAFNAPQTAGTAIGAGLVAVLDYRLLVIATAFVLAASSVFVFRTPVADIVDETDDAPAGESDRFPCRT